MALEVCSLCKLPATICCEPCNKLDDNGVPLKSRWYCSPVCHEADHSEHQDECPDLINGQDLFRRAKQLGEIAQELFYTLVEHTWAYDVSHVHVGRTADGDVVIEAKAGSGVSNPGGDSTCKRSVGGWLLEFPDEAFGSDDQEIKHALLADQNSIWAFVIMLPVVQALFKEVTEDMGQDIKEVVHYLPDTVHNLVKHKGRFGFAATEREELVYKDKDSHGMLKGVYRITLKNGTNIALDLAGAQFHTSHSTVLHWPTYLEHWSSGVKYRVPFHSHYNKHMELYSKQKCITHLGLVMELATYFTNLIENSESEIGIDLKSLPNEDHAVFHLSKNNFIATVKSHLQQHSQELDRGLHQGCATEFDLRHPKVMQLKNPGKEDRPQSLPFDIGTMQDFDWESLRKMLQMSGEDVSYREKKLVGQLLLHRCAFKMPGDWKLMFLVNTLPPKKVPQQYVSENPYWGQRKRL